MAYDFVSVDQFAIRWYSETSCKRHVSMEIEFKPIERAIFIRVIPMV